MGTTTTDSRSRSGFADALFPGTKQRVLGLLFAQPERTFYAKEVISLVGSGSGAVQRELAVLEQSGLVTMKIIGNQKHYQANAASPIFAELSAIVQKTIGLAVPLREALAPIAQQITAAFVYGSVAKRTDTARSDIDLMLIGDEVSYGDVFTALENVGRALGRPVNPTILTGEEWRKRTKSEDSFLTRLLAQPKIWIIGGEDDIPS